MRLGSRRQPIQPLLGTYTPAGGGATPVDVFGLAVSLFGGACVPSAQGNAAGSSAEVSSVRGQASASANAAGSAAESTVVLGAASALALIPGGTAFAIFAPSGAITAAGIATNAFGTSTILFSAFGFIDASPVSNLVYVDAMCDGLNRIGAVAMGVDL